MANNEIFIKKIKFENLRMIKRARTLLQIGLIAAEYYTQLIYQSIGKLCLDTGGCVSVTIAKDYDIMLQDAIVSMSEVSGTEDSGLRIPDITSDSVSKYLLDAIIINEDPNFGSHHGTDYSTLLNSAFLTSISFFQPQYQEIYGGSTISEQLAKMRFEKPFETSRETRLERIIVSSMQYQQFAEIYGADNVDSKMMLAYLNFFDFGNGAIGIEKASQVYFSKSASELDLAEAVALATSYKNSYYYNPLNAASPDGFLERSVWLLEEVSEQHNIEKSIKDEALAKLREMHRAMINARMQNAASFSLAYDPANVQKALDAEIAHIKSGLPEGAQIFIRLEDLDNGIIYSSGGSEEVPALSLIKLPIMVSAYRKALESGVDLRYYEFESSPTDNFYGMRRGMILEPLDSIKESIGIEGMATTGYNWLCSMINLSSNTSANTILRWLVKEILSQE